MNPDKRIDIEDVKQSIRTDATGKPHEYLRVVFTVYGKGPYEIFLLREGLTASAVQAALDEQATFYLAIRNIG